MSARDKFLLGLRDCFGYDPYDFDGYTLPEITQIITLKELYAVYDYLGVE